MGLVTNGLPHSRDLLSFKSNLQGRPKLPFSLQAFSSYEGPKGMMAVNHLK